MDMKSVGSFYYENFVSAKTHKRSNYCSTVDDFRIVHLRRDHFTLSIQYIRNQVLLPIIQNEQIAWISGRQFFVDQSKNTTNWWALMTKTKPSTIEQ